MNKAIYAVLGLLVGGAAGVFASRNYFKSKYETIANEEIRAAMKECKAKLKANEIVESEEVAKDIKAEPEDSDNRREYEVNPSRTKYARVFDNQNAPKPDLAPEIAQAKPEPDELLPRIISYEDFGEIVGYEQKTLYYFDDEILADEDGVVIEKGAIPRTVGTEFSSQFGEFADDCVYVRNDRLKTDFEIMMSLKEYKDEYPSDEDES